MGLGIGIFLIAVGAVLAFAVHVTTSGIDVHAVGWILMVVGAFSVLLSMIFWSSWAGPAYFSRRRSYYDGPYDGPVGPGGPAGPVGPPVTRETRVDRY
jgi:hypothetical protein